MIGAARWRNASTREQCIALYPGSSPGRASTLRPDGLRVAQPRETGGAKRVRRSWGEAETETGWGRPQAPSATAGPAEKPLIFRLLAPFLSLPRSAISSQN